MRETGGVWFASHGDVADLIAAGAGGAQRVIDVARGSAPDPPPPSAAVSSARARPGRDPPATIDGYRRPGSTRASPASPDRPRRRGRHEALGVVRRVERPQLAEEIEGIAAGAGLRATDVAALNARTECCAAGRARARRVLDARARDGRRPLGPCRPGTGTTGWRDVMARAATSSTATAASCAPLTEYGIVGKIGVTGRGLGLQLNILHHDGDGADWACRCTWSRAGCSTRRRDLYRADGSRRTRRRASASTRRSRWLMIEGAEVRRRDGERSSRRAALRCCPADDGVLAAHEPLPGARGRHRRARAASSSSDSYVRLGVLQRAVRADSEPPGDVAAPTLGSRLGGGGAICCRPRRGRSARRHAGPTLATGRARRRRGPP